MGAGHTRVGLWGSDVKRGRVREPQPMLLLTDDSQRHARHAGLRPPEEAEREGHAMTGRETTDADALRKERDALRNALSEVIFWLGDYPRVAPAPHTFPMVEAAIARLKKLLV